MKPTPRSQLVEVRPKKCGGQATIKGTRITTVAVYSWWRYHGSTIRGLARMYNRTEREIEEAIRYEVKRGIV